MNTNEKKLDEFYAALMLIEILHDKGLINAATVKAIRANINDAISQISNVA